MITTRTDALHAGTHPEAGTCASTPSHANGYWHPAMGVTAGAASEGFAQPLPTLAVGVAPDVVVNVGAASALNVPVLVYCGTSLALSEGTCVSDGGHAGIFSVADGAIVPAPAPPVIHGW